MQNSSLTARNSDTTACNHLYPTVTYTHLYAVKLII